MAGCHLVYSTNLFKWGYVGAYLSLLFQGNSPIWSLCEAGDALVTGGESGAVVRTVFGKKEAIEVETTLEETR